MNKTIIELHPYFPVKISNNKLAREAESSYYYIKALVYLKTNKNWDSQMRFNKLNGKPKMPFITILDRAAKRFNRRYSKLEIFSELEN